MPTEPKKRRNDDCALVKIWIFVYAVIMFLTVHIITKAPETVTSFEKAFALSVCAVIVVEVLTTNYGSRRASIKDKTS